jgi:hypothetical protein
VHNGVPYPTQSTLIAATFRQQLCDDSAADSRNETSRPLSQGRPATGAREHARNCSAKGHTIAYKQQSAIKCLFQCVSEQMRRGVRDGQPSEIRSRRHKNDRIAVVQNLMQINLLKKTK